MINKLSIKMRQVNSNYKLECIKFEFMSESLWKILPSKLQGARIILQQPM